MYGLMQKDLCLLFQRSRALIVLIGVGILTGFTTDGSFVVGYLTMICAILTIGTISYDEFDNGYPFLLTLPITRKTYVAGKYLFCLLGGLAGWVLSVLLYAVCAMAKGAVFTASDLVETVAFLPVFALMTAIMFPIQLKYGAEKSRLAVFAVGGFIYAVAFFVMRYLPDAAQLPAFLAAVSPLAVAAVLLLLSLASLAVSYLISLRIMESKEF